MEYIFTASMSATRARQEYPDKTRQLKRAYLTIPASSHSADHSQALIQSNATGLFDACVHNFRG